MYEEENSVFMSYKWILWDWDQLFKKVRLFKHTFPKTDLTYVNKAEGLAYPKYAY